MGKGTPFLRRRTLALSLLVFLLAVGVYQTNKPLPEGVDYRGAPQMVAGGDVRFLRDLTFRDGADGAVREQEIFDEIFDVIDGAREYILVDMFLFNSYSAASSEPLRALSDELVSHLVEKKKGRPSIAIDFITDPINTVYGGSPSAEIEALRAAGINVIITDLRRLRDSNPGYSSLWRTFIQWFGNSEGGLLPHPFSRTEAGVPLRSYLDMLNFKANHRKVIVADDGGTWTAVVASANPHNASSAHSNVALRVSGSLGEEIITIEEDVALLSGGRLSSRPSLPPPAAPKGEGGMEVTLLTESRIKEAVLEAAAEVREGGELWLAMFYLSDRDVVEALLEAALRGVEVRLVLDPNRDAFGFEKNGIPNRQVARELREASAGKVEVRWYDTHGEQFHSKMVYAERGEGEATVILGSANLTRRNLDAYNLELDFRIRTGTDDPTMTGIRSYLDRIWTNSDGRFTVDYGTYEDDSPWKALVYRFQEYTGLCSF